MTLLRRLFACMWRVDWSRPLTARGGGPMLDRELDADELHIEAAERGLTGRDRDDWIDRRLEARIRADERRRVIRQENTAFGQPPRCLP